MANEVIVTDIKMPFLSMVILMVKWAVASIPAFIILAILWTVVFALVGGSLGMLTGLGRGVSV